MKTKYIFSLTALVALFAVSCANEAAKKASDPHAGMDHNTKSNATTDHNDHSMDHSAMKSSTGAATAEYDLQFIDTMIAHHRGALDMASLIKAKAEHAELKAMGVNIISSQQKEVDEMQTWRNKWFAGKPEAVNMEMAGMSDSMKGMDMKKLDSLTGKAFDLEFIAQMTPHHVGGSVVMAKEALQKSQRDEIKKLATAIIKDQQAEIEQMRGWQANWK